MSDFLYFVPGRQRLALDEIRKLGLGYAFDGNPSQCRSSEGPTATREAGVVLSRSDRGLGYFPDKQTWRPRFHNDSVWVGVRNDEHPTPEQLERQPLIDGEWLRLEDGHQWLAPKARLVEIAESGIVWQHNLPTRFGVDESGELIVEGVKPRFQRLWDLAMQYEQAHLDCANRGEKVFHFAPATELVGLAMQANYHVDVTELALLGVLDAEMRSRVLSALVDMGRQEEFAKKKLLAQAASLVALATGNGSPGSEVTDHTTAPPLPT